MIINSWAIAYFVLIAISLFSGLYKMTKGTELTTPVRIADVGFVQVIAACIVFCIIMGMLGAYN